MNDICQAIFTRSGLEADETRLLAWTRVFVNVRANRLGSVLVPTAPPPSLLPVNVGPRRPENGPFAEWERHDHRVRRPAPLGKSGATLVVIGIPSANTFAAAGGERTTELQHGRAAA